ncbi:hypothetical protein LZ32DRAFT_603855 [Colletotrichum eremochloae]|nr:hypothetical protein LZ32DRAFT_603855 [Colletotrichum eremochloae]
MGMSNASGWPTSRMIPLSFEYRFIRQCHRRTRLSASQFLSPWRIGNHEKQHRNDDFKLTKSSDYSAPALPQIGHGRTGRLQHEAMHRDLYEQNREPPGDSSSILPSSIDLRPSPTHASFGHEPKGDMCNKVADNQQTRKLPIQRWPRGPTRTILAGGPLVLHARSARRRMASGIPRGTVRRQQPNSTEGERERGKASAAGGRSFGPTSHLLTLPLPTAPPSEMQGALTPLRSRSKPYRRAVALAMCGGLWAAGGYISWRQAVLDLYVTIVM